MTAVSCPYCGAAMNSPLKFCVSCGRATTKAGGTKLGGLKRLMRGAVTKRLDDNISVSNFDRSKKSYRVQRGMRQLLLNLSFLLVIVLVYYFAVRFILKDQAALEGFRSIFTGSTETPKPAAKPASAEKSAPAVTRKEHPAKNKSHRKNAER
jgi:hypothetical protein